MKSKSKSYHSYHKKEPEPKKKSTFSKLADEFKHTVKPESKPAVVKEKVKDECLCCKNRCQCCEHPVGITTHFCQCKCHA